MSWNEQSAKGFRRKHLTRRQLVGYDSRFARWSVRCISVTMKQARNNLLIVGCSATKVTSRGSLPAIELYDGVNFRVLRKFFRESGWPAGLTVQVLSAEYGLLDVTRIIEPYERRMTRERASELLPDVLAALSRLAPPQEIFVNLGATYLGALEGVDDLFPGVRVRYAAGGIGSKMKSMKSWLARLRPRTARVRGTKSTTQSYKYFFPDWDDYVYEPFVEVETKDQKTTGELKKVYAHELFRQGAPYDGMLVSLAQLDGQKGALYRNHLNGQSKQGLRKSMRLPRELLLFGDCGAFSYAASSNPPFTATEAAELYQHHGFDVGASVDHIPLPEVPDSSNGSKSRRPLSLSTRRRRIRLTLDNAQEFISVCTRRKYDFVPIAVAHGLNVESYARSIGALIEMGYRHIALGGLVPKSDSDVMEVVSAARKTIQSSVAAGEENIWLHLFGILRPNLQSVFRSLGVSSFDSASYMRKAWLRADQNYLAPDGSGWYGTFRVPIATSKPMRTAAAEQGIATEELATLEEACLESLRNYDGTTHARRKLLKAIDCYGPLLPRSGEENHYDEKHHRLLRERPWEQCPCPVCRDVGIQVVVFRGANRNKRRGLHNTWVFYNRVLGMSRSKG